MHRFTRGIVPAAPIAALLLTAALACAQPPSPAPSGKAPRDSTLTGALVRHGWIEGGFGWIAAPEAIRARFEAGQGLAAGLQAKPAGAFLLRVGADYQIAFANGSGTYEPIPGKGPFTTDTVAFEVQSKAWRFALRAEAGLRAPGHIWLFVGGGRDYFDGGLGDVLTQISDDVLLRVPEVARDGWGWAYTIGAARSLQPFLQWPIGIDVHWRSLRRGDEDLRSWTIRLASLSL